MEIVKNYDAWEWQVSMFRCFILLVASGSAQQHHHKLWTIFESRRQFSDLETDLNAALWLLFLLFAGWITFFFARRLRLSEFDGITTCHKVVFHRILRATDSSLMWCWRWRDEQEHVRACVCMATHQWSGFFEVFRACLTKAGDRSCRLPKVATLEKVALSKASTCFQQIAQAAKNHALSGCQYPPWVMAIDDGKRDSGIFISLGIV